MRQIEQKLLSFLKASVTTLFALVFLLSLVWPYSSDYYSHDGKVRGRAQNHEKVEVATDLLALPAECFSGKNARDLQPEKRPGVAAEVASSSGISSLKLNPSGASYLRIAAPLFHWQPSIVIALRKIVI